MSTDLTPENAASSVPATRFLARPLWYWPEIAQALGAPLPGGGPEINGVSIDTRTLKPGDLFIALAGDPGERFHTSSPGTRDGHEFLTQAEAAGAAGLLVSSTQALGTPQLRVEDTLDGLWALARAARARHLGKRIAITGSSGKTTAKSFLASALSAAVEPGSLNNFWGVPLCLTRTHVDAQFSVLEIGTNQQGEIAPLAELVKPEVAILLNVHPAHLGNFTSFQALTEEKLSISSGLEDISQFVCEHSVALQAGLQHKVISFGEESGATVRLVGLEGASAEYITPRGRLVAQVPGGGKHRALTLGAVIAALLALDEDPQRAASLAADLVPKGRGNEVFLKRQDGGQWRLIDDSYNANPTSMTAALIALAQAPKRPTYAFIGEMLELGEDSEAYHLELLEHCSALDGVFCVGPGTQPLYEVLPAHKRLGYADQAKIIDLEALVKRLPSDGQLLIKGSNRVFWAVQFAAQLADQLQNS